MSLVELKAAVGATAAAPCALSCGTGDKTENEKSSLDPALTILGSVSMSDTEEAGCL